MIKNSTVRLISILKQEKDSFDNAVKKELFHNQLNPKQETIDLIKAYARSVKGVKMNSGDRALVSLN